LQKNLSSKLIRLFDQHSSLEITAIVTITVLCASVIFVYLFYHVAGVVYDGFAVLLSVVLPLLLSPPAIFIVLKLTKHLKEYRTFLDAEIQKSKEKEVILYDQARFVLMGEMMANISHQWKQPLNTINLSVAAARFSSFDKEQLQSCFDLVETNVNYLSSTVDDFLSFFDEKKYHQKKYVSEIVSEIKSIYEPTLKENGIELQIVFIHDAKHIRISSSITQILLNLLSNAKDALESSGGPKVITLHFTTLDNMLKIRCCDSGKGVQEDVLKNIFDSYFTTKEKSRGTGLGLYMSKQIIHFIFDGDIYVDMFNHACFVLDIPYGKNCLLEKK